MATTVGESLYRRIARMPALVAILAAPRVTMRRLLARPNLRRELLLVLLAFITTSVVKTEGSFARAVSAASRSGVLAIVVVTFLLSAVLFVAVFLLFSWIVWLIGRHVFDGSGAWRDIRAAVAWGLAPIVWALLYRVPFALFLSRVGVGDGTQAMPFSIAMIGNHVVATSILLALELATMLVWLVVSSFTVATAHRIEAGAAFGAIAMTLALPLVAAAAAILSS